MAVTAQSSAPYTAGSAIINVIRRYRDKGLTTPITHDVLARAGVSDGLIPRTAQALVTLELVDDSGQPTPTFQKMRSVPQADYTNTLAEWIRSVYADVFSFVDPAQDDLIKVRDAFRTYVPHGQQDRMVALFMALCAEAGIVSEASRAEAKVTPRKPLSRTIKPPNTPTRQAAPKSTPKSGRVNSGVPPAVSGLPPALTGLLQSIPASGGWTKEMRDSFVAAFGVVLDFAVPIVKVQPVASTEPEDEP